jgi:urea transport system substrate-binding protein
MGLREAPLRDAELLALDEINAPGGLLGKKVTAILEDPASDFTTAFH